MGNYYDPHTRCIKCDPAPARMAGGVEKDADTTTADDGTTATMTLNGVIVGVEDGDGRMMSSKSLLHLLGRPGGELIGEVIDIADPEENEMKSSSSSSSLVEEEERMREMRRRHEERRMRMRLDASEGGMLSPSFVEDAMRRTTTTTMREAKEEEDDEEDGDGHHHDTFAVISKTLLRRQRQLQSAHAQEYQRLLHKQERDWLWFHLHRLGEDRLSELLDIHQKEDVELHSLHQSEQREMLDFAIFKCMLPLTTTTTMNRVREQRQARVEQRSSTTSTKRTTLPTAVLANGTSTDMQKADEIKAVMRDRSITREERQVKSAEINKRYASSSVVVHDNDRGHDGEPRRGSTKEKLHTKKGGREPLADIVTTNSSSDSKLRNSSGSESDQDEEDEARMSARGGEGTMRAATTGGNPKRSVSGQPRGDENTVGDDPKSSSREDVTGTCGSGDDDASRDNDKEESAKISSGRQKARVARDKATAKVGTTDSKKAVGHPEASKGAAREGEGAKTSSGSKSRPIPSKDEPKKSVTEQTRDVTNTVCDHPKSSSHQDATNGEGASAVVAASVVASKPIVTDNPDDPLDIATDRTPMKTLTKRLKNNDPSLAVLKLDGRKQVKEDDWQALIESLAKNSTLTHLSISRCEINDSLCSALMSALKENAMLVEVRLNSNKGLTDDTGKGLIKLLSENSTLKHVGVVRTGISKKVVEELMKALEKRNGRNKSSKVKDERQFMIKELPSLSVGGEAGKESAAEKAATKSDEIRNSSPRKQLASSKETSKNSLISKSSGSSIAKTDSWRSKKSTSSNDVKKKESGRRQSVRSSEVTGRRSSVDTGDVTRRRGSADSSEVTGKKNFRRASTAEDGRRPPSRPNMRPDAHRNSMLRASVTAKTMAQLGEDITNVGVDISKLREQRKFRGECETCGRKCFTKTLFKTTPLTIPDLVENGRCLKCDP